MDNDVMELLDSVQEEDNSIMEESTAVVVAAVAAGSIAAGVAIDKGTRSLIQKYLNHYIDMNEKCIPFGQLTRETYTLQEAKEFISLDDKLSPSTKVLVYSKNKNDKVCCIAISKEVEKSKIKEPAHINNSGDISVAIGSKTMTTKKPKIIDMKVFSNYKKDGDYYMASMACHEAIGHPVLKRFLKEVHSDWEKFSKEEEKNVKKESVDITDSNLYLEADTNELVKKYDAELSNFYDQYEKLIDETNEKLTKAKNAIDNHKFMIARSYCNDALRSYPKLREYVTKCSETFDKARNEIKKNGEENIKELEEQLDHKYSFRKFVVKITAQMAIFAALYVAAKKLLDSIDTDSFSVKSSTVAAVVVGGAAASTALSQFVVIGKKVSEGRKLASMTARGVTFNALKNFIFDSIDESEKSCKELMEFMDNAGKVKMESMKASGMTDIDCLIQEGVEISESFYSEQTETYKSKEVTKMDDIKTESVSSDDIILAEANGLISAYESMSEFIDEKVDTDDAKWNDAKSKFMDLKDQYTKNIKDGEHSIELGRFTIAKAFIHAAKKNLSDMSTAMDKFTQINKNVNDVDDEKKKIATIVVASITISAVCLGVMKVFDKKVNDIDREIKETREQLILKNTDNVVKHCNKLSGQSWEMYDVRDLESGLSNLQRNRDHAKNVRDDIVQPTKISLLGASIPALALLIKEGHDIIKKTNVSGKEMLGYSKKAITKNMEYCDKLLTKIDKAKTVKESVDEFDENSIILAEASGLVLAYESMEDVYVESLLDKNPDKKTADFDKYIDLYKSAKSDFDKHVKDTKDAIAKNSANLAKSFINTATKDLDSMKDYLNKIEKSLPDSEEEKSKKRIVIIVASTVATLTAIVAVRTLLVKKFYNDIHFEDHIPNMNAHKMSSDEYVTLNKKMYDNGEKIDKTIKYASDASIIAGGLGMGALIAEGSELIKNKNKKSYCSSSITFMKKALDENKKYCDSLIKAVSKMGRAKTESVDDIPYTQNDLFIKMRNVIYEKCSAGEINLSEREALIARLRDRVYVENTEILQYNDMVNEAKATLADLVAEHEIFEDEASDIIKYITTTESTNNVIEEGTNSDIYNTAAEYKKKYKESIKTARKLAKQKKFSEAEKELKNAEHIVDDMKKSIKSIITEDMIGAAIGWMLQSWLDFTKELLAAIITLPLGGIGAEVVAVKSLFETASSAYKTYKRLRDSGDDITPDDLNIYKSRTLDGCDSLKTHISNIANKFKKMKDEDDYKAESSVYDLVNMHEISRDEASEILNYLNTTESVDDLFTEDSNLEIYDVTKSYKKKYCESIRTARKLAKEKKFSDAKKELKNSEHIVDDMIKSIKAIKTENMFEAAVGWLLQLWVDISKELLAAIITLPIGGIGGTVMHIKHLFETANSAYKTFKRLRDSGDDITPDDLNMYRSRALDGCDTLKTHISNLASKFDRMKDDDDDKYQVESSVYDLVNMHEISNDEASDILKYLNTTESVDDLFTEGTNNDIRKTFSDYRKKYALSIKAARSLAKQKKYVEAHKELDNTNAIVDEMKKAISDIMTDDMGSAAIGWIFQMLIDEIKGLIAFIVTLPILGIGVYVTSTKAFLETVFSLYNTLQRANKEGRDLTPDELNMYKTRTLMSCDTLKKSINSVSKLFDNMQAKEEAKAAKK